MSTTQRQLQHQRQKPNSTIKSRNSDLENQESVSKIDRQEKKKKKILIVDDEQDITYTLGKVLESSGFHDFVIYNQPLLALQNFKSRDYSLLITDIAMPTMNGFELYEHMKKIDAEIKVIFMTASNINYKALSELLQGDLVDKCYENKETTRFRLDEGRSIIIEKPVEIIEFIKTVNNQLQTTISQHIEEAKVSEITSAS